jgi:Xaa-Pro aminopeptidase
LLDKTDIKNQKDDWPAYKKFFMHGTSHFIGLDTHDSGLYHKPIEAGMVFTVEPGLYFNKDNDEIPNELKGIGIRIEDDILVTDEGHENLTASIPKEVDEIEKACQKNFKELL